MQWQIWRAIPGCHGIPLFSQMLCTTIGYSKFHFKTLKLLVPAIHIM